MGKNNNGIKLAIEEQENLSKKSWKKINVEKLPVECFFWVENVNDRNTWYFPYREGTGGFNHEVGIFNKAGKININAVRDIICEVQKNNDVPVYIKKKVESFAKRLGIIKFDKDNKPIIIYSNFQELNKLLGMIRPKDIDKMEGNSKAGNLLICKTFISIRDELNVALQDKFGNEFYIVDFSNKEVVYSKSFPDAEVLYKVGYILKNGKIILTGNPVEVERKTTYEKYDVGVLVDLAIMEKRLK